MLGSLLSYFELNKGKGGRSRKSSRIFNQIFPKLGILLIIFSIFFYNDRDPLPSIYSLVPLSGVSLIIWFSHKDEIITKILSNKGLLHRPWVGDKGEIEKKIIMVIWFR